VHRKNKQLPQAPSSGLRRINLQSVMLGNALTDPLIQMPSVAGYACDGPFAVFDTNSRQCRDLRSRAPICERMIKACYALDNTATCSPATFYCWYSLWSILDGAFRRIPRCYRTRNLTRLPRGETQHLRRSNVVRRGS
jgi:carboxypeptidase C (cathepsin A)